MVWLVTDLLVYNDTIIDHFIGSLFSSVGLGTIQTLIPGHPRSIWHLSPLVVWASN